jgi:DivIVA domain-containing protein
VATLLTYVFGLLLVGGLLFLVASFAFGRDEEMAPALPEGTPVELPDDRPATGADLRALRLSVVLRGYRMDEVDWVLDRLAEQVDARDREIARLRSVLHVEPVGVAGPAQPGRPEDGGRVVAEERGRVVAERSDDRGPTLAERPPRTDGPGPVVGDRPPRAPGPVVGDQSSGADGAGPVLRDRPSRAPGPVVGDQSSRARDGGATAADPAVERDGADPAGA